MSALIHLSLFRGMHQIVFGIGIGAEKGVSRVDLECRELPVIFLDRIDQVTGRTTDPFRAMGLLRPPAPSSRLFRQDLGDELFRMLREHRHRRRMTRETPGFFFHGGFRLQPQAEDGLKHGRRERGPVQQGPVHPPERFEVGGLLAHPFPFFVVTIVTLFAMI